MIYDGEYKNGKKTGSASEFDEATGAVLFTGEYKDGKKEGAGKEFDPETGAVTFEGEYKAGKKEGLTGPTWEQNCKANKECQKETRGNPPPDEGGWEEETARNDQEGAGSSGEYN